MNRMPGPPPAIVERGGHTQVITSASNRVRSYDLATGEVIWWATGLTGNCTPCPVVAGDTVFCMSGYEGRALLAIPIDGTGDVTGSIRWRSDVGIPYVPSPILYDGQLYFTQSNQGILTSFTTAGEPVFERERVPDLGDTYASPVGPQPLPPHPSGDGHRDRHLRHQLGRAGVVRRG